MTVALAAALIVCTAAQAATPQLSVTTRLQDRREVASGQRSYAIGFEDGRFYANGWHTTGEMGGVWTPPLKLLDGVWFGIDNSWVGQATKFTSGFGYTHYDFPDVNGLHVQRTDFAPDADRAVLFGLKLTNPDPAAKTVTVNVDAHSELMGAYPWGFTGVTPNASDNLPDHGSFDGNSLAFTDQGSLRPGLPAHDYAALVASNVKPQSGQVADTGGDFRGPQDPAKVCPASDGTSPPSACDDGPFGNGTGGQLDYRVTVPAHGSASLWIAAAGSDQGLADAKAQLSNALADPAGELQSKIASRQRLGSFTQVSLPGDRLLQKAITWGKQNLADLTQTASNLQIRWTNQGNQFPAPLGTVQDARWFGAGFPDYPWIFATDGEYTAFAAVALGQFQTIEDHLKALRDISEILNNGSGVVVHETVSDGSVWFGHDSKTTKDGTTTNDFNTDETIKFPSAVALVWRWTGDNGFMNDMYPFAKKNLQYVDQKLDVDHDGWPEGSGNVERTGMGPEKLDNGVYYMRALLDLADMAQARHDNATARWATHLADKLLKQFDSTWWDPQAQQYADSLFNPGNIQNYQKHWIGVVPMEAQLTRGDNVAPGVAPTGHAMTALDGRQTPTFSGQRPGNLGLFHTGVGGGADGKGDFEIFSLTTSIMAVGEGNYGRLGPDQQQRYTDANAETMFSEPATGGTPDEQPGAMPEIFPSTSPTSDPTAGIPANINRCWTCRSMFMQAWGNYGTAWSVVNQQLGVRPFLGDGALQVVPQVPQGQPSVAGSNIRLGDGSVDVFASRAGNLYTTKLQVHGLSLKTVQIGHTLPAGSQPRDIRLDGSRVRHATVTQTNRGVEVTVPVFGSGPHTLTMTTS